MKTASLLLALALTATAAHAATSVTFNFNTPGDTEGWTASTTPTNAVVSNFNAALGIDGTTGVLTSSDVDIDPQVLRGGGTSAINLGVGETWSTVVFRFRQLTGNPGVAGTAAATYGSGGTILFFNGSTENFGVGPLVTGTILGTGPYAGDTYKMTLTPESTGQWQVFTVDLSSAPTLRSQNITGVRFDPLGNVGSRNFEIDSIQFNAVPEPTGTVLTGLAALGLTMVRRRK